MQSVWKWPNQPQSIADLSLVFRQLELEGIERAEKIGKDRSALYWTGKADAYSAARRFVDGVIESQEAMQRDFETVKA